MSDLTLHQNGKYLSYTISGISITISLISGSSLLWAIPTTMMIGFGSYYSMKYLYRYINSKDPRNESTLNINYDIDFGNDYYGKIIDSGIKVISLKNNFSKFYYFKSKFQVMEYKESYPVPVINSDICPKLTDVICNLQKPTDADIVLIERVEHQLNSMGYTLEGKHRMKLIDYGDVGVIYQSVPIEKIIEYEKELLDIYADIYLDIAEFEDNLRLNEIKNRANLDIRRIYYG